MSECVTNALLRLLLLLLLLLLLRLTMAMMVTAMLVMTVMTSRTNAGWVWWCPFVWTPTTHACCTPRLF